MLRAAGRLFASAVPGDLTAYVVEHAESLAPELRAAWLAAGARRAGTWTDVFGAGAAAEEIFMAWHFARFTQHVTAAGKAEYPLPMFVNALARPRQRAANLAGTRTSSTSRRAASWTANG